MSVLELSAMTWEDVRDLDRAKAVAILPVGALQAHGPHLPLGTDVIIAEAMARNAAEKLSAGGRQVLLLPSLTFTPAPFGGGFPGTISLQPACATNSMVDIARSLGRHGFELIAIANAHLDSANIAAIDAAFALCRSEHLPRVVFPDMSRKPWGSRLQEE